MKFITRFVLIFVALAVVAPAAKAARVDILPRKIFISDRERSAELTILNLGTKPSFVRIQIISYRQDENGIYQELEQPLDAAFDPNTGVRISPKQFTLPVGGRQKIRLAIQKPASLPDGEYRFHIKALSYDQDEIVRRQEEQGGGVSLKMNIGVVIPVVFHKGKLTTGAKIENASLVSGQNGPLLTFDIVRSGQAGTLGTLTAYQDQRGQPVEVGVITNLNVFSEAKLRHVQMPLNKSVQSGPIRLVYTNDFGDKGIIDEVILQP